MLMPCFSQRPDNISFIENPDLTTILQDEPSGRFTQQCFEDLSLSDTDAGILDASDFLETKIKVNIQEKIKNHKLFKTT